MGPFIHISSPKFRVLPGEDDELVNEGMYGKSLAQYLEVGLRECGYLVPFFCCEDWGWWVELSGFPFVFGVCIYGTDTGDGRLDLYVTDGAAGRRQWSWRRFQFANTDEAVAKLHGNLVRIFESDPDIVVITTDSAGIA